jgi:hypothetical protein
MWTRLVLGACAVVSLGILGCSPEGAKDARSGGYAQELSNEMPKPKDDTPLFDPPPNVLDRDGKVEPEKAGG